jgi:arginine/lysine/ornithine decarboxylase
MGDQGRKPLTDAIRQYVDDQVIPFHTPGHKQGKGMERQLATVLTQGLLEKDLTEVDGLDNLHQPEGPIAEAQSLASELFGARATHFLVNGTLPGFYAALQGCIDKDGIVLMDRTISLSAWKAMQLAGFQPVLLPPETDHTGYISKGTRIETIMDALDQHPNVQCVVLSGVTRSGYIPDVSAIASFLRTKRIPLIVDETDIPYLCLLRKGPRPALMCGADAVIHGFSSIALGPVQGAMLHTQGDLINDVRVMTALSMVQSTSPSYLIMSALDDIRAELWQCGTERLKDIMASYGFARELLDKQGVDHIQYLSAIDFWDPLAFGVTADPGFFINKIPPVFGGLKTDQSRHTVIARFSVGKERLIPENFVNFIRSITTTQDRWPTIPPMTEGCVSIKCGWDHPSTVRAPLHEAIGCQVARRTVLVKPDTWIIYPGETIQSAWVSAMQEREWDIEIEVFATESKRGD